MRCDHYSEVLGRPFDDGIGCDVIIEDHSLPVLRQTLGTHDGALEGLCP